MYEADRAAPKPAPSLHADLPSRWRQLRDLAWLVGLVARVRPLASGLWVAVALAQGLLVPAQLWLTKLLVDALAAWLSGRQSQLLFLWLGLLAGTLLVEHLLSGLEPLLHARVREEAGPALQERALRQAAGLDLAAFEHQGYYDELNQALADADVRGPRLLQQVLQFLRAVPQFAGYAVALAMLTPVLLVVASGAMLPTVASFVFGGQTYWQLLREQTRDRRLADYYAGLLTERGCAAEVRLYGLADYLLARWADLFWRTRDAQRRQAIGLALRQRGSVLATTIIVLAGLWLVVAAGLSQASAGAYALLFQAINGLFQATFGLADTFKALGEQSGYASSFRAFLRLPIEVGAAEPVATLAATAEPAAPTAAAPRASRTLHPCPRPLRQGIRFEDVWFTYPGRDRPALAGVNLTIGAGETVALVGENGAGKTTLVKLLLGLYRPDAGRITLDGRDLRELDPRSVRAAMSAVFQQFVRYPLTFAENVGLGQPAELADHRRLERAVSDAGAAETVRALPAGYATVLGPDIGGADLSGGQWQRVAIARGVFREADVLVLDEPTAALDPLAELAVFERFAALARGRTTVLISHRLGMARLADRVLVLAHGRVVEDGPHDVLLRAGGAYAALFAAQARWYA